MPKRLNTTLYDCTHYNSAVNDDNNKCSSGYNIAVQQVLVVQKLDSAIHWINPYPEDKYYENQLRYPLDSNLSSG